MNIAQSVSALRITGCLLASAVCIGCASPGIRPGLAMQGPTTVDASGVFSPKASP